MPYEYDPAKLADEANSRLNREIDAILATPPATTSNPKTCLEPPAKSVSMTVFVCSLLLAAYLFISLGFVIGVLCSPNIPPVLYSPSHENPR